MNRVITYVDGFNLYFGLKEQRWKKYYWLDLCALSRVLLKPGQNLVATYYFTARICDNQHNQDDRKRQSTYIEALQAVGALVQEGHYLPKDRRCRSCNYQWRDYEEKETDVNIAIQMLSDAFEDRFDTALVISGDSDLTTPIRYICQRFPGKRVVVAFPPKRHSSELKRHASAYLHIGEDKLHVSQLPEQIVKPGGFILQRPAHWI